MKNFKFLFLSGFLLLMFVQSGCYWMRSASGGGQITTIPKRTIDVKDIALVPGYKIEPVVSGLTFPSGAAFDDDGKLYVIEAGYSYGEKWATPKLYRVDGDKLSLVASGTDNGPWTGITWHDGSFYVAEGGEKEGGKILKISKSGTITTLISNLPSIGDHHTNGPVVKDNYIYFGQGVATNSAVVGEDNFGFGWLTRHPDFHDIPCEDIVLTGQNYTSPNVLTEDPDDKSTTGAFVPFGTSTSAGQVIKGEIPCTGSVLRIPINGGKAEYVAWGFRNPFGLALSPNGKIYVTDNGYDERGSRPVWGTGDILWELKNDTWYGWPDYSAGKALANDEEFKSKGFVKPLLQKIPNTPPQPVAIFGVHSSSDGLDFSKSDAFGFKGDAFVAQFGDMAGAGKVLAPVGFKIVRVDMQTGVSRDFAVNKGKKNGPASWMHGGGLERPVAVKFNNEGTAMYVVDFGIMKTTKKDGIQPQEKTGMIWKITKQ
jgi:glucose/arabinose dehydrogenase